MEVKEEEVKEDEEGEEEQGGQGGYRQIEEKEGHDKVRTGIQPTY